MATFVHVIFSDGYSWEYDFTTVSRLYFGSPPPHCKVSGSDFFYVEMIQEKKPNSHDSITMLELIIG